MGFPGSTRVSHELRPAIAVVKSGKRRAEGWTVPSAFRMRGPATATSGWLSSQSARRQHASGSSDAVRIEQEDELGRGGAGAVVHAGGEAVVAGDAPQLDVGKLLAQEVGGVGLALVIDDDDRCASARPVDRRQAPVELFVALVVDDDDRDAGRLPPDAHVVMITKAQGSRLKAQAKPSTNYSIRCSCLSPEP